MGFYYRYNKYTRLPLYGIWYVWICLTSVRIALENNKEASTIKTNKIELCTTKDKEIKYLVLRKSKVTYQLLTFKAAINKCFEDVLCA